MISEGKIKRDGKIISQVVKKYDSEEGAQFAMLANASGANFFTYSGNVKLLVDGIAIVLGSLAASSDDITENVYNYVAETARKIYRQAKGLPEEEIENGETVEAETDTAQSGTGAKARNTKPTRPRKVSSKSGAPKAE